MYKRLLVAAISIAAVLLASCGGGGGGGTILPPPNGGGGGGGGDTYPQHYTTDLDGFWSNAYSNFHFTYSDPQRLLTSAARAEFEANILESYEASEGNAYEVRNGKEVVGTLPTLGYDTLQMTENRISKLSDSQYESVVRFVGTVSGDDETGTVEIEGIATGFVNAARTVWTGSSSVRCRISGSAGAVWINGSCNFVATKG